MKLSENEAILTGLWASNCATIQQVLILKFAFTPEKFPGLSRNGPLVTSLSSQLMGWIIAIYNNNNNNNNLFINTIQVQRRRKNMRMQETIENEMIEII